MPWVVGGWAVGVVLLSLWNLGGWIAAQRLKVLGIRPVSTDIASIAEKLARCLKLSKPVRVLQSLLAETPVVIGWVRPVVLLPTSILTGLTPMQLEAILAHELAHVRRHDYLVNLFQVAAETLLFYHPAVWWISRRIRLEREQCCDDVAVSICGDRCAYVESLAALEEARMGGSLALAALGSGGSQLLIRVRRLLGFRNDLPRRSAGAVIAGFMLLLAALMLAACYGNDSQTKVDAHLESKAVEGASRPATRPARTVTYHRYMAGHVDQAVRVMVKDGRQRTENSDQTMMIHNAIEGKSLFLDPRDKTATISPLVNVRLDDPMLSVAFDDPMLSVANIEKMAEPGRYPVVPLGKKQIDGRDADGIQFNIDGGQRNVWRDAASHRLVSLETNLDHVLPTGQPFHMIYNDIVFDVPLDDSLFAIRPPPGYEVRELSPMGFQSIKLPATAPATRPADTQPHAHLPPRLEFRLVAEPGDPSDADEMIDPINKQPLRVLKAVELDDRDVARASYETKTQDGDVAVDIEFDDLGTNKFEKLTTAHVNHRLAVVFDGKLLSAPMILSPMSKWAVIMGGRDGFTRAQVASLMAVLDSHAGAAAGNADVDTLRATFVDLNRMWTRVHKAMDEGDLETASQVTADMLKQREPLLKAAAGTLFQLMATGSMDRLQKFHQALKGKDNDKSKALMSDLDDVVSEVIRDYYPRASTAQAAGIAVDDTAGHATQWVERLLKMPTATEDPQGRLNAARWQLIRDIGALGDPAIPVLEAGRSRAKTALQRRELTEALTEVRTPAGTEALLGLAANEDDDIRGSAITRLAEHIASPRDVGGSDQILPVLVKLAPSEKVEMNRKLMCMAMGTALNPPPPAEKPDARRIALAIGMLRDRLQNDSSPDVRFYAACLLTESGDFSGREELKKVAIAMQAVGSDEAWGLGQLVPAIERVSGKKFGPVPMNPMIASNANRVPELKAKRKALLDEVAAWAKSH